MYFGAITFVEDENKKEFVVKELPYTVDE